MKARAALGSVINKVRRKREHASSPDVDGADVRIRISPIMLIMAAIFVAFGMSYEFCCSLTAVILHECAHARVAKRFGYTLNEIRIMPYGAALCGNVDMSVKHELLIAAAGPIFNLVIGLIFAALWWLVPTSYMFTQTFCVCNMYIGIFNILPVYPLDGGRVCLALLSRKFKRNKAYIAMRIVSAVFGVVAIALFVLSAFYTPNACFLSVGIFMVASALIPDDRARYRSLFSLGSAARRLSHPLEIRRYAVSTDVRLSSLFKLLDTDKYTVFDVYDGDMSPICVLDESSLVSAIKDMGYVATAGDAVKAKTRY